MHLSEDEPLRYRYSEPSRYDFEAPAEAGWAEKSAYLLRLRHESDQAEVLEAFGLAAPIAEEDVVAFLREAQPRQTVTDDEAALAGFMDFPLGHEVEGMDGILMFPSDHRPLCLLRSTLRAIADSLYVTWWDATLYLLADVPATVPWVTIEWEGDGFGDAFRVRVGSAAVTGDEIARAYNEVKRQAYWARPPQQVGVNDVAIFYHEVQCRRQGLTWEGSWDEWRPYAERIGATPYNDAVAYRNKVNDLRKRFGWMRDELDKRKRQTGRPRKTDDKGGQVNERLPSHVRKRTWTTPDGKEHVSYQYRVDDEEANE